MRRQDGPRAGLSQFTRRNLGRARGGRFAALLVSLALLTFGAGSALGQSGGSSADPTTPPPATTPTGGTGWTVVQNATWYGPGLWGNSTACGLVLRPTVVGVANKNLPCGTNVTFTHNGRSVAATVIDRGPFRKGYAWDFTKKLAKRLGFLPVGAGPVTATVTLPSP